MDLFPDLIIRLDSATLQQPVLAYKSSYFTLASPDKELTKANSDQPFFDLRIPPSTYFQSRPQTDDQCAFVNCYSHSAG